MFSRLAFRNSQVLLTEGMYVFSSGEGGNMTVGPIDTISQLGYFAPRRAHSRPPWVAITFIGLPNIVLWRLVMSSIIGVPGFGTQPEYPPVNLTLAPANSKIYLTRCASSSFDWSIALLSSEDTVRCPFLHLTIARFMDVSVSPGMLLLMRMTFDGQAEIAFAALIITSS